jgi:cytochrome b subunit of formate dehydrogenase
MARKTKQTKQTKKGKVKEVNTTLALIYFIEQKVLEILAIAGVILLFAGFSYLIHNSKLFLNIMSIFVCIAITVGFIYFLFIVFKENWEWAKKRARK